MILPGQNTGIMEVGSHYIEVKYKAKLEDAVSHIKQVDKVI